MRPVWYKRISREVIDAKRLSDGRVAFTPTLGPFGVVPEQGYWATNLEGSSTERFRTTDPVALPTDHHDFLEIPGGHALLSYPLVSGEDLRPFGSSSDTYADGVIQEVDGAGAQIWRWNTSDHFAPNSSTFPINFADTNGLGCRIRCLGRVPPQLDRPHARR